MNRLVPLYVLDKIVMEIKDEGERAAVFAELSGLLHDGYGFVKYEQLQTLSMAAHLLLLSYMSKRTNLIALCLEAAYVYV